MNKEIKEKLLSQLSDINYKYYDKVMDGEALHDSVGNDFKHLHKALRYVPNTEIKKWIKEMKKEIKDVQSNTKKQVQREKDRSEYSK